MNLNPGDLLACHGTDFTSVGIKLATCHPFAPRGLRWGPSHVGIIVNSPKGTLPWLMCVESTTLRSGKCLILGKHVSGLQASSPADRIDDYTGAGGWVDVYRLTRGNELTKNEKNWLQETCLKWIGDGAGYDYGGAGFSGTRVLSLLRHGTANTRQLFCSEFVAYLLQSLCRMNRSNPGKYNPSRLLIELVRTGVYYRSHGYVASGGNLYAERKYCQ